MVFEKRFIVDPFEDRAYTYMGNRESWDRFYRYLCLEDLQDESPASCRGVQVGMLKRIGSDFHRYV